jgi:hypothetical protein
MLPELPAQERVEISGSIAHDSENVARVIVWL